MELLEINKNRIFDTLQCDYGLNSDIRVKHSMTYDHFFSEYLLKNKPCLIETGIADKWPCAQKWISNGAPDLEYLKEIYGDCKVPVADCSKKYFNAQRKSNKTFAEYMDYWKEFKDNGYPEEDMPLLYLKDWHCVRDNPDDIFYKCPSMFASDWLNEYYLAYPELNDDYMFVYMGPKGSWTPLHFDVFKSYSWSANITGRKRWLMFPPGEDAKLRNEKGRLYYDLDDPDMEELVNSTNYLEIFQGPGEILFVPSGWHHQVWNLEDTISVNHNWVNGCNIDYAWGELKKALKEVIKEIEDCINMDNWSAHCQVMLKTSHGMDYLQFYDFLSLIIERRLEAIDKKEPCTNFDYEFGMNHILFDLDKAKITLNNLIRDCNEKDIYDIVFRGTRPEDYIERIETILQGY